MTERKAKLQTHLLISEQLPTAKIGVKYNALNGNDAETVAASKIINACNAEVRWGSRNEDNSKIDLILSFNHPWLLNERIVLLVQIKSGNDYAYIENDTFNVKKKVFKAIKRASNNICLVWLDQINHNCHWAYIHPNSAVNTTTYGKNHLLSPAFKFEIARCIAKNFKGNNIGGRGIILKGDDFTNDINSQRKILKIKYKYIKSVDNPLLGKIEFTNLGWKHLFRASRKKEYKNESLKVIPYLKLLTKQYPSAHWISNFDKYTRGEYEFSCYEYILMYSDVKIKDTHSKHTVNLKILEEVGYPKNWNGTSQLSQKIMRKVTFLSCSLK